MGMKASHKRPQPYAGAPDLPRQGEERCLTTRQENTQPCARRRSFRRRLGNGCRLETCRERRGRISQFAVCAGEGAVISKPLMVLITLAGAAGYFGLAVWGAGGFRVFFAEPARIALTIVGFATPILRSLRFKLKRDALLIISTPIISLHAQRPAPGHSRLNGGGWG